MNKEDKNRLIKFEIPSESLMHGTGFIKGNMSALVVRCYAGEWTVFYYRDCHLLMNTCTDPYIPKMKAMSDAASYMKTGVVPTAVEGKEVEKIECADELMIKFYKDFGIAL